MTLYGYYRSSAAYRVRIALNLKGLNYDQAPINLVKGEQCHNDYRGINPQGLVPVLEVESGQRLTQSLTICEYLDEVYPAPALLPKDSLGRARVRGLSQLIACEIHPLNNLRVLKYLVHELKVEDKKKTAWYRHWIARGFDSLEAMLNEEAGSGDFCHGDSPSLADICLAPQVYNAQRFECDLAAYPRIRRIVGRCNRLEAFIRALPENQPDAV